MNICVIGGSGFIGTRLVELLVKRHRVRILDKVESQAYPELSRRVDVRDAQALQENLEGQDAVVLLAAEHRDDISPSSLYYDVNVQGAKNVLAGLRQNRIHRILFTSSVAVYGLNRDCPSEEDTVDPFGDYGKSKFMAEEELRGWCAEDVQNALTIVRPTVVFGEGNRGNVYNLLKQISSGRFVMVGPGANRKSMAYVGNVAGFLGHCVATPTGGEKLYNYKDEPDLSMHQLVSLVRKHLERSERLIRIALWLGMLGGDGFDFLSRMGLGDSPVSALRIKKFCASTVFAATRIRETGFEPRVTLLQGIRQTLDHEFRQ